jgi:hypothetical protein
MHYFGAWIGLSKMSSADILNRGSARKFPRFQKYSRFHVALHQGNIQEKIRSTLQTTTMKSPPIFFMLMVVCGCVKHAESFSIARPFARLPRTGTTPLYVVSSDLSELSNEDVERAALLAQLAVPVIDFAVKGLAVVAVAAFAYLWRIDHVSSQLDKAIDVLSKELAAQDTSLVIQTEQLKVIKRFSVFLLVVVLYLAVRVPP